jgi:hypothetical protein
LESLRLPLSRPAPPQARGDNDFRGELHQFCRESRKTLQMSFGCTDLDRDNLIIITERA